MSDQIKHECGIAVLRLLKPIEYYQEKYGSWQYGINKLYLLMEKQHNRGQDGAGTLGLKLNSIAGKKYLNRTRSVSVNPIIDCFNQIFTKINDEFANNNNQNKKNLDWIKNNIPFAADLFMGHLRYGTFGKNNVELVHPVLRVSNWKTKTLALAGNFNLTNVDELFQNLIKYGQHPKEYSDTITALELIGLFLDDENQKLFREYKNQGFNNHEISTIIEEKISIANILKASTNKWDGGYVMCGVVGHGDAFIVRDPWGIRPAYYYCDDEVFVATSERPVIQTTFNVPIEKIHEIEPGFAMIIKRSGLIKKEMIRVPEEKTACSFERIYFSRGTDVDINKERQQLGELIVPQILDAINFDLENSVFSFIPNTAELAFYGMLKGVENYLNDFKEKEILKMGNNILNDNLKKILSFRPRVEKIAVKDAKMRTFITQDNDRNALVEHIYDITYGTIRKDVDNLVIMDDSIVRGTTLKQSILKILDRLKPKKIVIVSSSPQIRYPDCYGIDMAKIGDFIAFQAAIELLKENNQQNIIDEIYQKCKEQENLPKESVINYVKKIYANFTDEQISNKISQMVKDKTINAEVEIIFQSIENLHISCPNHKGDWYFTGNYPTSGGNKVVNTSFINYYENIDARAY
ncbi:MAG: amidophosphoribosyltransferase, partial [Bacteroidales bacterium]|nr:amidophosphoribosyltransferase [Bacteroidales bacterium]